MIKLCCATSEPACWIRLPTGCARKLSETTAPWFWFIDPQNSGNSCQNTRLQAFKTHCSRRDVEHYWGVNPPGPTQQELGVGELSYSEAEVGQGWQETGVAYADS